jgi:hypothetical protein
MRSTLFAAVALSAAAIAQAQDVSVQAGKLRVNDTGEKTFTGAATYTHPLSDYLAGSVSYINEGHPDSHHRDGFAAQFWLRTPVNQYGLSFGAGAGKYYTFDTTYLDNGDYTNDHNWASIYSLQATYQYPGSRWYNQVQLNRIAPRGSKDTTTSLMVGVGYRFDGVRGDKLHLDGPTTDEALTLMAGLGISNSTHSENSATTAIEYRRAVGRYVDWTVTAINEGNSKATRRNGVATQLWMIRSLNPKVELGVGVGPYFTAKVPDAEGARTHKGGLVSVGGRYHFARRIVAEATFNRVVTDYHRDADMLLLGLGYSF